MLSELAARLGLTKAAAPAAPTKPAIVNPFGIHDTCAAKIAALDAAALAEARPERARIDAMTAKAKELRAEAERLEGEAWNAGNALSLKGDAVERKRVEIRAHLRADAPPFLAEAVAALQGELQRTQGSEMQSTVITGHGDRVTFTNGQEMNEYGQRIASAIQSVRALTDAPLAASVKRERLAEILEALEAGRPTKVKVPKWAAGAVADDLGAENVVVG